MKLKKIASLMLAGIMAVSMLAGCKSGTPDPKPNEGEEENTASGYSAVLGEKLADTLSKNDLDDVFTFADNADDQKALKKVINTHLAAKNFDNYVTTLTFADAGTLPGDPSVQMVNSFRSEVGAKNYIGQFSSGTSMNTAKSADIWIANGSIDMDVVMDMVAKACETALGNAKAKGNASSTNVDYAYEVAVSVENVSLTYDTTKTGSVNFIAVTVTRTAEVA